MRAKVDVLCEGMIRRDGKVVLEAHSSSTLVLTHNHHDHCENSDLFPQAQVIAFESEPAKEDEETRIDASARLVRTPGHTPGSVSLFVDSDRKYAIVGDALPIKDNYLKWVPPGLNYDPDKALRSMRRIVDWADVVVPGHGAPFEIRR